MRRFKKMRFLSYARKCLALMALIGLCIYIGLIIKIQYDDRMTSTSMSSSKISQMRLLYIVLTTEQNLFTRSMAIRNTWASSIAGHGDIIFACNCKQVMKLRDLLRKKGENARVPRALRRYMSVRNFPILHLKNIVEKKSKMGLKVIAALNRTYNLYANTTNWYYMVDDDTFVFTQNLVKFIRTRNTSEPYMYGFHRVGKRSGEFVYGGSGILLTNTSMRLLVEKIRTDGCEEHIRGYGDWTIGRCSKAVGLQIGNTSDELGLPRFHAYTPYVHYYGPLPSKVVRLGTHNGKIGKECCSLQSIAFHYVNTTLMHQMYANNENFLRDLLEQEQENTTTTFTTTTTPILTNNTNVTSY